MYWRCKHLQWIKSYLEWLWILDTIELTGFIIASLFAAFFSRFSWHIDGSQHVFPLCCCWPSAWKLSVVFHFFSCLLSLRILPIYPSKNNRYLVSWETTIFLGIFFFFREPILILFPHDSRFYTLLPLNRKLVLLVRWIFFLYLFYFVTSKCPLRGHFLAKTCPCSPAWD